MDFEFLRLFLRLLNEAWFEHAVTVEKTRQAKALLRTGIEFLKEHLYDEARIRFGAGMAVCPDVLRKLTNRERQKLLSELAAMPGGYSLFLELDRT